MRVEWYGQSAFALRGERVTVAIDPLGDVSRLAARGLHWSYPAITGLEAQLLLVTHEHRDHNGVEAVGGDPWSCARRRPGSSRRSARCWLWHPSTTRSRAPNRPAGPWAVHLGEGDD